jgi:PAS domain-containing protein
MNKPTYDELLVELEELKKQWTNKKSLEKELRKAKILMQAAFDQSPVPLMVVTYPDFTFRIINKATEDFLLADASNYLNKIPTEIDWTWKEYYPDDTPVTSLHDLPLPTAMQGITTLNKEMYIVRHDVSIVWELVSASPINDDEGVIIGGILAITDITERKKTEQILKEKEKKLKEKNEDFEAINEELRESNEDYMSKPTKRDLIISLINKYLQVIH